VIYSGNRYLTKEEMTENAKYILTYLTGAGWTKNAVCAVLGNMETESTINPDIWESLNYGDTTHGYGLVQWTPATKYLNWCTDNGLTPSAMNSNLARILYEVQQNIQWVYTGMTFEEFTKSMDTPYNLAVLFLHYYEQPLNPNDAQRGNQATYWYENLTGGVIIPPEQKTHKFKWNLYLRRRV
jgi:hypothetical protein